MKKLLVLAALAPCLMLALVCGRAAADATEALDEVNQARAARGLPAFIRDDGLTEAAKKAAHLRAINGIAGHLASDFACLSPGVTADAAGCACWEPSLGWGACTSYESYSHAGAAWEIGPSGKRFMHIFVRGSSGSTMSVAQSESWGRERFSLRERIRSRRR
jgi:hypothetical protein